jgi:glycosyltransferase involved in cell wall biosynthesis
MCVSPNAADPEQFSRNKYNREAIRKQLGVESGIVCGYVGAFHHWHGIHTFIDKVIPVMKKNNDTTMLMIGDGELLDDIKAMVEANHLQDRFIFTGRIPHDDVPKYIAAMDIAVLPDSNSYGSPMKIFEYMAMEVPVIAPDYSPLCEVITSGESGWLFHKNDFDDCIRLFETLLTNLDEVQRIGANAREYIINERQWANNAQDIIDMYLRIK